MAENQSPDLPETFQRLSSNLFNTEKSLVLLREALPVEKQETFTKRIQSLSSDRVAFLTTQKSQSPDQNTSEAARLQERLIETLNEMVSEVVENAEVPNYSELEPVTLALKRSKNSTRGMITGNFQETIETMDRILTVGESLIVQGYQKLFIDNLSMKDKLQAVIDERQNLPTCSKPLDTLVLKQKFCEKQLGCLLNLLEEANTLTDLINKLQDFDKRQIQFQQASQVTTEAMKKFFYRSDTRKTNERRRTYLSVSYADPSNSREGLDILRDQINSVIRNLNNLCDMEDAKVRTVKRSDLGDECERAYDEAISKFEEEKELIKKTLGILVAIEDNQVDLDKSDQFIEDLRLPEESPQGQLDYIKFFVKLGLTSIPTRLEQARLFHRLVLRFDQDHSTYSNLVDSLQSEVQDLQTENKQLKVQVQSKVINQMSEGSHSLQELIELQEHLKRSIQEELESQVRKPVNEIVLTSHAVGSLLLEMSPDDDLKMRVEEFETEYAKGSSLVDLVDLAGKQTAWVFRIVSKLGRLNEALVHSNLTNLKKARNLREGREGILGRPSEFPLATMDRVLTDMIKAYMAGLDERKPGIDSVVHKQAVLSRLLREYKS
jgi:hypothetical protein